MERHCSTWSLWAVYFNGFVCGIMSATFIILTTITYLGIGESQKEVGTQTAIIKQVPKDIFVSDALGECDAVGTETAKVADCRCEATPVPVSDAGVRVTITEYKILGLTIFRSEKTERD